MELVELRDDHTRVWEVARELETTHPDGTTTVETVKSYIHEKASGLCYRDGSGNFVPAVAEWRETPEGFIVDRCAYGLAIGKTIGSGLRYTVEGNDLLLRPAHLMISDGLKEAHLATLNPESRGFIVPGSPSLPRFPEAFGPGYDLEYVAEKDGFHQNLIIAEPPRLPVGFEPQETAIYLYTDMNLDHHLAASGLDVLVEGERVDARIADLVSPPSLGGSISFCRPRRSPGEEGETVHAFYLSRVADSSPAWDPSRETIAEKRLMKVASTGAAYLVESVPYSYFSQAGLVYPVTWDYWQKSGSIGTETWEPRYTYWVTGNVTVSGTLTILSGTTVKLNPSKKISIAGKVVAKGEPYNFVTFTNSTDGNCGEPIPEAPTGRWDRVFDIQSGSSSQSAIQYCKFAYGNIGIDLRQSLSAPIAHNIFYDMNCALNTYHCSVSVHNNLMLTCMYYNIYAYGSGTETARFTNNTIDYTNVGICSQNHYRIEATDNLFSLCGTAIYTSDQTRDIRHNGYFQSGGTPRYGHDNIEVGACPFQSSGIGVYFLNTSNPGGAQLRDAGSRSPADAGLAHEVFTVNPPEEVGGTEQGTQTWSRVAVEDPTRPVDIGYHHNRVDRYLPDNYTISGSGSTLVIEPGVAVGIHPDKYLMANDTAKLISVGDPSAGGFNLFTNRKSLSMNIESPKFAQTYPIVWIYSSASPESRIQFTRTTWLGFGVLIGLKLNEPIRDNVFALGHHGIQSSPQGNKLFNNLAHENIYGAHAAGASEVANCTFDRNDTGIRVSGGSGQKLHIRDTLFTKNSNEGILIYSGAQNVLNYYNAFWENGSPVTGGAPGNGSRFLGASPYYAGIESPWQTRYRLKQDSSLVDGGTVKAADAGLAAYTTANDNRYDSRNVDMGFHFLARRTIWVDQSYADQYGEPDGSRLKPYGNINEALEWGQAVDGTTLLVLPGRYLYGENASTSLDSPREGVHIIGSGSDITLLEGKGQHPLFKIERTSYVTLAAFAVSGKDNDLMDGSGCGGGILCFDSTVVFIRDCLIADNEADYGGGLYIEKSEVTIEDCVVHQNTAISGHAGGGVCIVGCDSSQYRKVTIRRCIISNNAAGDPTSFLSRGGGGIYCRNIAGETTATDPLIEDCVISHNRATAYHGAGVYLEENCNATILNCVLEHNMATHPDSLYSGRGGGIYLYNSSPTISGCTISDNTSVAGGWGINCVGASSSPAIVNCTVVYNTTDPEQNGTGIYNDGANPRIVNSIVWGHYDDLFCCSATYSCIEDPDEGEGNIHIDPLLVGSIYGPYHLGYNSTACIDKGTTDPAKLPPGYTIPQFDIDRDNRVIGPKIDIGSDERHGFLDMIGIRKDCGEDTVVITWKSENGTSYVVYRSQEPFANHMRWEYVQEVAATGGTASWTDTSINFQSDDQRYYRVQDKNGTYAGLFTRPVGFVNAKINDVDPTGNYQSTFFAIPLELKYEAINGIQGAENESLGAMISEELSEGDTIKFLKLRCPDETQEWTHLRLTWVSGVKKWFTTDPTPVESKERFTLGEVFRIVQSNASPVRITLLGFVPSRSVSPMVFRSTRPEKHVEFGYPYPVSTSLNAIPFVRYGGLSIPPESKADEIWVPVAPEEQDWKKLWLKRKDNGTTVWMDGQNEAVSPDIDIVPGKGFRYYGPLESGTGADPPYRVYYGRVPVARPYRTE